MNIWTLPLAGVTYLMWLENDQVKNRALTKEEHDFLFRHKDIQPILEKLVNDNNTRHT